MNFLNSFSIKSKLLILYFLVTVALLVISVIGFFNMNAMKKNLDSLYFGSLIPVVNLNKILDSYSNGVEGTFHKLITDSISSEEASVKIDKSLADVMKLWQNYATSYKSDNEKPIINATTKQITNLKYYLDNATSKLSNGYRVEKSSVKNISSSIKDVRFSIDSLIIYEVEVADIERKNMLSTYDNTILQFSIIMTLVVLIVLYITYTIFKSIELQQMSLQLTKEQLEDVNEKLKESTLTDELTSLHNRRYFNIVYEREFKRSLRSKTHFAFMMLDIDFFKPYNDTYGHMEGDETLKKVSAALKEIFKRSDDYLFRLGGEEFGVILCDGDKTKYENLAKRVCKDIENLEIVHEGSEASKYVTISCGMAINGYKETITPDELIKKADEALYDTKASGRNAYKMYVN